MFDYMVAAVYFSFRIVYAVRPLRLPCPLLTSSRSEEVAQLHLSSPEFVWVSLRALQKLKTRLCRLGCKLRHPPVPCETL